MRLILLFLLLSLGADAQIIRANPFYRPTAYATGNLLLDNYPNAVIAYSLRKLDKDYTGSAIRVRKDTTGQPEQDIGFTANGDLDTAALKTFLNARSGFVTTWYNQADSAGIFGVKNATQTTALNQARIALLGVIDRQGTRPCVLFDGANDKYLFNEFAADTIYNIFYAVKRNSTTTRAPYFTTRLAGSLFSHWSDNNLYIQYKSVATWYFKAVNSTSTAFNLYEGFTGGGQNQKVYLNNSELTLGARSTFTSNNANWGAIGFYNSSNVPAGTASEMILYQSDQQTNRSGITSNINTYYSIY